MKFSVPKQKFKLLGLAEDKSLYDFPFASDTGNRFLFLLIALMTYLSLLAGAAGLTLTGMATRWTSGIEGHMTAELSPFDANGVTIADPIFQEKIHTLETALRTRPDIRAVQTRLPKEVGKLVEPWLGKSDLLLGQVPLPALMNIDLKDPSPAAIQQIQSFIKKVSPDAQVETHQSWLNDVLRLTSTLSFTAYLIGFVTLMTTIFAVAGAVRARMAAYHDQLEILHLIGARDEYIVRQFQKHALIISLRAAGTGFLAAAATFLIIDRLAGSVSFALVPSLVLPGFSFLFLLCIPVAACMMTMLTARITVLQALRSMT